MHAFTSLLSLLGAGALLASSASAHDVAAANFMHRRASSVTPTSPGPGDSFNQGSQCTMQWTPGTGNAWKSMTIKLMTGANQDMTELTDVATDIDGTDLSTYSWTCPDVSPNSAIYFYQFTDRNDANPTWTTRFTIAGTDGESTTPTETKQPSGESIPWGTGALATGSSSSSSTGTDSSSSSSSTLSSSSSANSSSSDDATSSTTGSSDSTSPSQQTTQASSQKQSSGASSKPAVQTLSLSLAALALAALMA